MLFSLEYDRGAAVSLYVIPDAAGATPRIHIRNDGVELLTMSANDVRPQLLESGRHATGLCGFRIDKKIIPNLATYKNLEIVDTDNELVIYRRPRDSFKPAMKMFRLETHLLPLWRVDEAIKDRFQYWYKSVDMRGSETSQQVFVLHECASCYISGRLLVKAIEPHLEQGFKTIAMVRDPYDELAERLLILKNVGVRAAELLGARDAFTFEAVIEELAELEQFDFESCKRFFRRAPMEVLSPLSNPFARQLTTATPDESLTRSWIAVALSALSQFEVLGLRSEPKDFSQAVAEVIGFSVNAVPIMNEYSRVTEIGTILRDIPDVELLLEHDLELFGHTRKAFGMAV